MGTKGCYCRCGRSDRDDFTPIAHVLSHSGMVMRACGRGFGSQGSIALNWHSRYSGTRYSGTWLYLQNVAYKMLVIPSRAQWIKQAGCWKWNGNRFVWIWHSHVRRTYKPYIYVWTWGTNMMLCTHVPSRLFRSTWLQLSLYYINDLVQDCSNSSALAMELLQSCTNPSILCSG